MQIVTQQQVEAMHERIIAATGCCVTNARVHHAMENCGEHFMRVVNYVRNETLWAVQEGNGDFASARVANILAGYLALQGWRGLSVVERRELVAHHRRMMEGAKCTGMPASEAFRVSSNLLKRALIEIAVKGATV
jgi:hypothetical protein